MLISGSDKILAGISTILVLVSAKGVGHCALKSIIIKE